MTTCIEAFFSVAACLLSIPAFGANGDLTLNGSAKIVTGPNGNSVLWLTPAEESQAGSAFTTNSIPLGPSYEFSTFFQFQMTDPGIYGASDNDFRVSNRERHRPGSRRRRLGLPEHHTQCCRGIQYLAKHSQWISTTTMWRS